MVKQRAEGAQVDVQVLPLKADTPAFRLALAAKDADLVQRVAAEHDLDLPLVAAIARRFAEAAKEHGDQDFSATYLLSTPKRD